MRRGNIYVLDYKPEAEKEKKAPAQLLQYVRGLLFRTGLPMDYFRCAWFDGKYYYEFDPNKLFQISTVPDPDWLYDFGKGEKIKGFEYLYDIGN